MAETVVRAHGISAQGIFIHGFSGVQLADLFVRHGIPAIRSFRPLGPSIAKSPSQEKATERKKASMTAMTAIEPDPVYYRDATEIAELIRTRQLSAVEVMHAHLDRIEAINPKLNAVVTLAEGTLEAARRAEAAVLAGEAVGPLHGVPFTVKDSIDTAGVPTQRGSPIFKGRIPDADATAVARMKGAGAILLAKTNLPEFSYATETDNLLTGRSNNPWNVERTPGGSSGGEAASIAAGMSPLGLGSDVAISLRGPAAHTGIIALKATHGRIPMTGHWPRVPRRFWHVGPMARSVRDIALAYSILAGPDGADGYCMSFLDVGAGSGATPARPLRVGWLVEPSFAPVDPEVARTVRAAADALRDSGCVVEPVQIPALDDVDSTDVFWKLQEMEAKPAFLDVTAGHERDIFKYVRAVFDSPDTTITDQVSAEQAAERLRDGFAEYFGHYDALLCPVTPVPAHAHGATSLLVDGKSVPALHIMVATVPFNVAGLPAISMRFGTSSDGLPIGIQLVAKWSAESTLFLLASLLEGASPVCRRRPDI